MKPEEAILMMRNRIDTASEIAGKGTDGKAFEDMQMAIESLKEVQQYREIGSVGEIKQAIEILSLSENDIIKTFHELNEYRKIGTVEQVKNQKENLNVAYQIINDYEQYGTIEDFKMAQRYMHLVKSHGTIGRVIDSCAEYEEIGTVKECREAVEKRQPKAPKDELKINPVIDYNVAYVDADTTVYFLCPNCGEMVGIDENVDKFCRECGQAIDTEDLEGMEDE